MLCYGVLASLEGIVQALSIKNNNIPSKLRLVVAGRRCAPYMEFCAARPLLTSKV